MKRRPLSASTIYMNAGDLAIEENDIPGALKAYQTAEEMFPDNLWR